MIYINSIQDATIFISSKGANRAVMRATEDGRIPSDADVYTFRRRVRQDDGSLEYGWSVCVRHPQYVGYL